MANTQPAPQPTAATKFLVHTLYSFAIGLLLAMLTAIGQYISTAGDTIDFKIVASVGGAAFFAYLLSHFNKDITANQAQLEQGMMDIVTQAVQQAHAPLYNAVGQLQQQVAQVAAVQVAPPAQIPQSTATTFAQPLPLQTMSVSDGGAIYQMVPPQPMPISQLPTQSMPAIVAPQPWQPPDPAIHWGDTGIIPVQP